MVVVSAQRFGQAGNKKFRHSPRNPGNPMVRVFILFIFLGTGSALANAQLTVQVLSPTASSVGSPVYYEAYATNPSCNGGISSMRIYSAPGVVAFKTAGNHIETFIDLQLGSYNTVVQAWDNCGNVAKQAVNLTTTSTAGVTVFLPAAASSNAAVHVAASAQGTCAISSMRIYTAPSVSPYSIDSNQMDAFVTLAPGSYSMVAQAWDTCSNVYKSPFHLNVTTASDNYLYSTSANGISQFKINQGVVTNPNAPNAPPSYPAQNAESVVADPGGNFVYAVTGTNVTGFQVDHGTGKLYPMPGSPFLTKQFSSVLAQMDPSGHFLSVSFETPLYLVTYAIDRSSGALSAAGSVQVPQMPNFPLSLSVNPTGSLVYLTAGNSYLQIYGYSVDRVTGALNAVSGNPYTVPNALASGGVAAGQSYLYVAAATNGLFGDYAIYGYSIASDGSLNAISQPPVDDPNYISSPLQDWFGRTFWGLECSMSSPCLQDFAVATFPINSADGTLGAPTRTSTGISQSTVEVEDHSGQYLYVGGQQCIGSSCDYPYPPPPGFVGSGQLNSTGVPTKSLGGIPTHDSFAPAAIAVSP